MVRIHGNQNNPIRPVNPAQQNQQGQRLQRPGNAPDFGSVLQEAINSGVQAPTTELRFSGHARERLRSREIELSPEHMERLRAGVDKASGKGAKESLVLMDDIALIVSIRNNVVITAATGKELKENIFTNIDSAVIV